jgi:hypothetical protein
LNLYIKTFEGNYLFKPSITINFSKNKLSGCYPIIYCDYSSKPVLVPIFFTNRDTLIHNKVIFESNFKLPFQGDIEKFCENGGISTGAPCDDGNPFTCNDKILKDCSCKGEECMDPDLEDGFTNQKNPSEITEVEDISTKLRAQNYEVSVFPNPASKSIKIDLGSNYLIGMHYSIELINVIGQVVFHSVISTKVFEIDLTSLQTSGLFIINIKSGNGTTIQTKKIILQ